jgi:hypothetical protein
MAVRPTIKQEDVPDIEVDGQFKPDQVKIRKLKASHKRKGWTLDKQEHIPGTTPALPGHTILTFFKFM